MIPWIQVYSNLPTHRKTAKLADELGLTSPCTNPRIIAAGMLVSLWTWAIQNAYDGDLSDCSAATIAEACCWKKSPERLVQALKRAGFLDDDLSIHDWEEYSSLLIDKEDVKKAKTRERVKEYRQRKRNADVTPCNADVTVTGNADGNAAVTPCNAPTIPYHTIPVPNVTKSNDSFSLERKKGKKESEPSDELEEILRGAGIYPTPYT